MKIWNQTQQQSRGWAMVRCHTKQNGFLRQGNRCPALEVIETMKLRNRFATMSRVVRQRQKRRADAQLPGTSPAKRLKVPWSVKSDR